MIDKEKENFVIGPV